MDTVERWSAFQPMPDQEELTEEQLAEVQRFAHVRIAAMLSVPSPGGATGAEAEAHLAQAYRVVGLEAPHIRWFDSPIAFVMEPEPAPQSLELLIRTSVEARVAAMCAEGGSEPVWGHLFGQLEVVGDAVWQSVGRLIQEAAIEQINNPAITKSVEIPLGVAGPDVETTLWLTAQARLWDAAGKTMPPFPGLITFHTLTTRLGEGVQAYRNAGSLALSMCFAHLLGPHDLLHFARFNERVSGFRLGRHKAWLVRKPIHLARDEHGSLHAEDGMCVRYRDGWGFYAWHGHRVSERLILHPEQLTIADWLEEDDLDIRRAIQERIGHRRFSALVGGLRLDKEELVVDLGQGLERTSYFLYRDGDVPSPRVCRLPQAVAQHYCAKGCPYLPLCPSADELFIRREET